MSQAIASQAFASQVIASQTILGWAIGGAALMKGQVVLEREKNNSLIVKKPPNLVETKRENRYRNFQIYLAFLLLLVNKFLLQLVIYKVTTLFAIYYCG